MLHACNLRAVKHGSLGRWPALVQSFRLRVDGTDDQRFINLLRQSHIMPFVPLPYTGNPEADGSLFAVLQPIDAVAPSTLRALAAAHGQRAAWQEGQSSEEMTSARSSEELVSELPHDPRAGNPVERRKVGEARCCAATRCFHDSVVIGCTAVCMYEQPHRVSVIESGNCKHCVLDTTKHNVVN